MIPQIDDELRKILIHAYKVLKTDPMNAKANCEVKTILATFPEAVAEHTSNTVH